VIKRTLCACFKDFGYSLHIFCNLFNEEDIIFYYTITNYTTKNFNVTNITQKINRKDNLFKIAQNLLEMIMKNFKIGQMIQFSKNF
jgi:hypothetical protein